MSPVRGGSPAGARIAIVGAGVAGLAAAYELRRDVDLTVFERDRRVGGHANTVAVGEGNRDIGIDTGFIVCNRGAYPQLMSFFDELGVETLDHSGGFNFFDLDSGSSTAPPSWSSSWTRSWSATPRSSSASGARRAASTGAARAITAGGVPRSPLASTSTGTASRRSSGTAT